ncbi:MAG: ribose-phosphate pyrophosphokinase-like domain-containing protein, partial [Candidatus Omnitrophica bacterium]|nr:ribose-phosphate pyrophosphokinase-like domain-containing protein [Candidatus Omnitrophota bacterium]
MAYFRVYGYIISIIDHFGSLLSTEQNTIFLKGSQDFNTYPLLVPEEAQTQSEQKYGKDRILTKVEVSGFDLQNPEKFLDNHYEVLKQRLETLKQILGRAPPQLKSWRLIITTDLALTQGNVASCDIASKEVFIHPYFFQISEEDLTKEGLTLEQFQLKILYHELISHITKGITDETDAMRDTQEFMRLFEEYNGFFLRNISASSPIISEDLQDKILVSLSMEGNIPEFEGYDAQAANTKGGLGVYFGDKLEALHNIGIKAYGIQPGYSKVLKGGKYVDVTSYTELIKKRILKPVYDNEGRQLSIKVYVWDVNEPNNPNVNQLVEVRVFEVNRAGTTLYMLMSDIFDILYVEDRVRRFAQEIVFGKAAYQLLKILNIIPDILHLNEAHTVVAAAQIRADETFDKTAIVYTNHTLVPAGLERFSAGYLGVDVNRMMYQIGIPADKHHLYRSVFLNEEGIVDFCRAAVKIADVINGVSKEHARATERLFKQLYGEEFKIEVVDVLNGSGKSWQNPLLREIEESGKIPDEETLWQIAKEGKIRALAEVKARTGVELNPEKLTVWLVRRLAEYKSQHSILRLLVHLMCADREEIFSPEKLKGLWFRDIRDLSDNHRNNTLLRDIADTVLNYLFENRKEIKGLGLQVVVGGPNYMPEWAEEFRRWAELPELKGRFVYVPESDALLLKMQAMGADICITCPRPLEEACGTSSQRTALNGGVNISSAEADQEWLVDYNPKIGEGSGFLVGPYHIDTPQGPLPDSALFYRKAPRDIFRKLEIACQLFYKYPERWKKLMYNSYLAANASVTAEAMERRYVERVYLLALNKRKESLNSASSPVGRLILSHTIREEWIILGGSNKAHIIAEVKFYRGDELIGRGMLDLDSLAASIHTCWLTVEPVARGQGLAKEFAARIYLRAQEISQLLGLNTQYAHAYYTLSESEEREDDAGGINYKRIKEIYTRVYESLGLNSRPLAGKEHLNTGAYRQRYNDHLMPLEECVKNIRRNWRDWFYRERFEKVFGKGSGFVESEGIVWEEAKRYQQINDNYAGRNIQYQLLRMLLPEGRNFAEVWPSIRKITLVLLGIERVQEFKLNRPIRVIIPVAGMQTRMPKESPAKCLIEVEKRPILYHILDTLSVFDKTPILIVNPNTEAQIRQAVAQGSYQAEFIQQIQPRGDGHAIMQAARLLGSFKGDILVVWGDMAVLSARTVLWLVMIYQALGDVSLAIATSYKATPYAPVIEDKDGNVIGSKKGLSLEFGKDDVGVFIGSSQDIFDALEEFPKDQEGNYINPYDMSPNKKGEMNFVQISAILARKGKHVIAPALANIREFQGVNTEEELSRTRQYRREILTENISQIQAAKSLEGLVDLLAETTLEKGIVEAALEKIGGLKIDKAEIINSLANFLNGDKARQFTSVSSPLKFNFIIRSLGENHKGSVNLSVAGGDRTFPAAELLSSSMGAYVAAVSKQKSASSPVKSTYIKKDLTSFAQMHNYLSWRQIQITQAKIWAARCLAVALSALGVLFFFSTHVATAATPDLSSLFMIWGGSSLFSALLAECLYKASYIRQARKTLGTDRIKFSKQGERFILVYQNGREVVKNREATIAGVRFNLKMFTAVGFIFSVLVISDKLSHWFSLFSQNPSGLLFLSGLYAFSASLLGLSLYFALTDTEALTFLALNLVNGGYRWLQQRLWFRRTLKFLDFAQQRVRDERQKRFYVILEWILIITKPFTWGLKLILVPAAGGFAYSLPAPPMFRALLASVLGYLAWEVGTIVRTFIIVYFGCHYRLPIDKALLANFAFDYLIPEFGFALAVPFQMLSEELKDRKEVKRLWNINIQIEDILFASDFQRKESKKKRLLENSFVVANLIRQFTEQQIEDKGNLEIRSVPKTEGEFISLLETLYRSPALTLFIGSKREYNNVKRLINSLWDRQLKARVERYIFVFDGNAFLRMIHNGLVPEPAQCIKPITDLSGSIDNRKRKASSPISLEEILKDNLPKIVFIDYDRTLSDEYGNVPQEIVDNIAGLLERKIKIALTTGRKISEKDKIEQVRKQLVERIPEGLRHGLLLCFGFYNNDAGEVLEQPANIFIPLQDGKVSKASVISYILRKLNVPLKEAWFIGDDFAGNDRSVLSLVKNGLTALSVATEENPPQVIPYPKTHHHGTQEILRCLLQKVSSSPISSASPLSAQEAWEKVRIWARNGKISEDSRRKLASVLEPQQLGDIEDILKSPVGRRQILSIKSCDLLSFKKRAGLQTGPPETSQEIKLLFASIISYLHTSRLILERALQAYLFGENHGPVDLNNPLRASILDRIIAKTVRNLYLKIPLIRGFDKFVKDINHNRLVWSGEGCHFFTFILPGQEDAVLKYIKFPHYLPPLDPVPAGYSWSRDWAIHPQTGELHHAVWECIRSFILYGDVATLNKVYITRQAFARLNNYQKGILKRFINMGIVKLTWRPIEITPIYPDFIPPEKRTDRQDGKITLSVAVIQQKIEPLPKRLEKLCQEGKEKEAREWIDRYFGLVKECWLKGEFFVDLSLNNVGIIKEKNRESLRIFDAVYCPVEFSQLLPKPIYFSSLEEALCASVESSLHILWLIGEQNTAIQEIVQSLWSYFTSKADQIQTLSGWKPDLTSTVALKLKVKLIVNPVFKLLQDVLIGQYPDNTQGMELEVAATDEINSSLLKSGLKFRGKAPVIIVINPTQQVRWEEKEWGRVFFPEQLLVHRNKFYNLADLLTGEEYSYPAELLLEEGLRIGLASYRLHILEISSVSSPLQNKTKIILEIDGRALVKTFGCSVGRVPKEFWDWIASLGVGVVWFKAAWQESPASFRMMQEFSRKHGERGLKRIASGYDIYRYELNPQFAHSDEEFKGVVDYLNKEGISLILDFVTNHLAIDSPYILEVPGLVFSYDYREFCALARRLFPESLKDLSDEALAEWLRVSDCAFSRYSSDTNLIIRNARLGPFDAHMSNLAQINYMDRRARNFMIKEVLKKIAYLTNNGGLRADLAFTALKVHILDVWANPLGIPTEEFEKLVPREFWEEFMEEVDSQYPGMLVFAETYEWDDKVICPWRGRAGVLQRLGMIPYDKAIYDLLREGRVYDLRRDLFMVPDSLNFRKKSIHFTENHDEFPAKEGFMSQERALAATLISFAIAGYPLIPLRQLFGMGTPAGVFLEPGMKSPDAAIYEYEYPKDPAKADPELVRILPILSRPVFREGSFYSARLESPSEDNLEGIFSFLRHLQEETVWVLVNYSQGSKRVVAGSDKLLGYYPSKTQPVGTLQEEKIFLSKNTHYYIWGNKLTVDLPGWGWAVFPFATSPVGASVAAVSKQKSVSSPVTSEVDTLIQSLDASPNLLWSLIKDNYDAREEFRSRCSRLLKTDTVKLLQDTLRYLASKEIISIKEEDIQKIDIVIFGDYLRGPRNAASEDVDALLIFKGQGRWQGVVRLYKDLPPFSLIVRNIDDFKKESNAVRNLKAILFGCGAVIYGGILISEIKFKPLLVNEILNWAKGLLKAGDFAEDLGELCAPRTQWERYLEALIYIQHLLPVSSRAKLKRSVEECIFFHLHPSEQERLKIALGKDFAFKEFFVHYYLGGIKVLPWLREDSQDFVERFKDLIKDMINDIAACVVEAQTDRDKPIEIFRDRFPDGELYIRILNPDAAKETEVTLNASIESSDKLVELVLIMDALRLYGARHIRLILNNAAITNGLEVVLGYCCDSIVYHDGTRVKEIVTSELPGTGSKKSRVWIHYVLYQHGRLRNDAQEAAESIHARSAKIGIWGEKKRRNPLNWRVILPEGLKGTNVVLIHSMENNKDIAELWVMLVALQRAGAGSISLLNTYEGYARQDKAFKPGEAISALAMLKIINALVDNHMALNIHYGKHSGQIKLPGYDYGLYNLNAFIPVAEKLVDTVAMFTGHDAIAAEFSAHPLLLVSPDDGAFTYVQEAAQLLPNYIKAKYGIDTKVDCGYMDKTRISGTQVKIAGHILKEDGTPITEAKMGWRWVFVLDDETSWGTTLFAATYALVRKIGLPWPRVLTGVVHGKFSRGLKPFATGLSEKEITIAMQQGRNIEPQQKYIDEGRELMPPRWVIATKSVALRGQKLPRNQQVSIGPILSYAVKRLIGQPKDNGVSSPLITRNTLEDSRFTSSPIQPYIYPPIRRDLERFDYSNLITLKGEVTSRGIINLRTIPVIAGIFSNNNLDTAYLRMGNVIFIVDSLSIPFEILSIIQSQNLRVFRLNPQITTWILADVPIISVLLQADIRGKIVEDLGAGEGFLSLLALTISKVRRVVAIEYDKDKLLTAKYLLESYGFRGRLLEKNWFTFKPKNEDFILINTDLNNWFRLPQFLKRRICGGEVYLRIASIGPTYPQIHNQLVQSVAREDTIAILGGYFEDALETSIYIAKAEFPGDKKLIRHFTEIEFKGISSLLIIPWGKEFGLVGVLSTLLDSVKDDGHTIREVNREMPNHEIEETLEGSCSSPAEQKDTQRKLNLNLLGRIGLLRTLFGDKPKYARITITGVVSLAGLRCLRMVGWLLVSVGLFIFVWLVGPIYLNTLISGLFISSFWFRLVWAGLLALPPIFMGGSIIHSFSILREKVKIGTKIKEDISQKEVSYQREIPFEEFIYNEGLEFQDGRLLLGNTEEARVEFVRDLRRIKAKKQFTTPEGNQGYAEVTLHLDREAVRILGYLYPASIRRAFTHIYIMDSYQMDKKLEEAHYYALKGTIRYLLPQRYYGTLFFIEHIGVSESNLYVNVGWLRDFCRDEERFLPQQGIESDKLEEINQLRNEALRRLLLRQLILTELTAPLITPQSKIGEIKSTLMHTFLALRANLRLHSWLENFKVWKEYSALVTWANRMQDLRIADRRRYIGDLISALSSPQDRVEVLWLKIQDLRYYLKIARHLQMGHTLAAAVVEAFGSSLYDHILELLKGTGAQFEIYNDTQPVYVVILRDAPEDLEQRLKKLYERQNQDSLSVFQASVFGYVQRIICQRLNSERAKKVIAYLEKTKAFEHFHFYGGLSEISLPENREDIIRQREKIRIQRLVDLASKLDEQAVAVGRYQQMLFEPYFRDFGSFKKSPSQSRQIQDVYRRAKRITQSSILRFDEKVEEHIRLLKRQVGLNFAFEGIHPTLRQEYDFYNPKGKRERELTVAEIEEEYQDSIIKKDRYRIAHWRQCLIDRVILYNSFSIRNKDIIFNREDLFNLLIAGLYHLRPNSDLRFVFRVSGDECGIIYWFGKDKRNQSMLIIRGDIKDTGTFLRQHGYTVTNRDIIDKVLLALKGATRQGRPAQDFPLVIRKTLKKTKKAKRITAHYYITAEEKKANISELPLEFFALTPQAKPYSFYVGYNPEGKICAGRTMENGYVIEAESQLREIFGRFKLDTSHRNYVGIEAPILIISKEKFNELKRNNRIKKDSEGFFVELKPEPMVIFGAIKYRLSDVLEPLLNKLWFKIVNSKIVRHIFGISFSWYDLSSWQRAADDLAEKQKAEVIKPYQIKNEGKLDLNMAPAYVERSAGRIDIGTTRKISVGYEELLVQRMLELAQEEIGASSPLGREYCRISDSHTDINRRKFLRNLIMGGIGLSSKVQTEITRFEEDSLRDILQQIGLAKNNIPGFIEEYKKIFGERLPQWRKRQKMLSLDNRQEIMDFINDLIEHFTKKALRKSRKPHPILRLLAEGLLLSELTDDTEFFNREDLPEPLKEKQFGFYSCGMISILAFILLKHLGFPRVKYVVFPSHISTLVQLNKEGLIIIADFTLGLCLALDLFQTHLKQRSSWVLSYDWRILPEELLMVSLYNKLQREEPLNILNISSLSRKEKMRLLLNAFYSYIQITEDDPKIMKSVLYRNMGIIYSSLGEDLKAIDMFSQAMKIDPSLTVTYFSIASKLAKLGFQARNSNLIQEALKFHRQGLRLTPDYPGAHTGLGCIYYMEGDYKNAKNEFRKEIMYNPLSAEAYFNLGLTVLEEKGKPENLSKEVVDLWVKAVLIDPAMLMEIKRIYPQYYSKVEEKIKEKLSGLLQDKSWLEKQEESEQAFGNWRKESLDTTVDDYIIFGYFSRSAASSPMKKTNHSISNFSNSMIKEVIPARRLPIAIFKQVVVLFDQVMFVVLILSTFVFFNNIKAGWYDLAFILAFAYIIFSVIYLERRGHSIHIERLIDKIKSGDVKALEELVRVVKPRDIKKIVKEFLHLKSDIEIYKLGIWIIATIIYFSTQRNTWRYLAALERILTPEEIKYILEVLNYLDNNFTQNEIVNSYHTTSGEGSSPLFNRYKPGLVSLLNLQDPIMCYSRTFIMNKQSYEVFMQMLQRNLNNKGLGYLYENVITYLNSWGLAHLAPEAKEGFVLFDQDVEFFKRFGDNAPRVANVVWMALTEALRMWPVEKVKQYIQEHEQLHLGLSKDIVNDLQRNLEVELGEQGFNLFQDLFCKAFLAVYENNGRNWTFEECLEEFLVVSAQEILRMRNPVYIWRQLRERQPQLNKYNRQAEPLLFLFLAYALLIMGYPNEAKALLLLPVLTGRSAKQGMIDSLNEMVNRILGLWARILKVVLTSDVSKTPLVSTLQPELSEEEIFATLNFLKNQLLLSLRDREGNLVRAEAVVTICQEVVESLRQVFANSKHPLYNYALSLIEQLMLAYIDSGDSHTVEMLCRDHGLVGQVAMVICLRRHEKDKRFRTFVVSNMSPNDFAYLAITWGIGDAVLWLSRSLWLPDRLAVAVTSFLEAGLFGGVIVGLLGNWVFAWFKSLPQGLSLLGVTLPFHLAQCLFLLATSVVSTAIFEILHLGRLYYWNYNRQLERATPSLDARNKLSNWNLGLRLIFLGVYLLATFSLNAPGLALGLAVLTEGTVHLIRNLSVNGPLLMSSIRDVNQETVNGTRRIDKDYRLRQIESIIRQYGGVITEAELAKQLGLKVQSLRGWAKKENVDLGQYHLISASFSVGDYQKGKIIFQKEEARCKYLIFKIMLIHLGLLNLTALNKELKIKEKEEGLSQEDRMRFKDTEIGLARLPARIKELDIPQLGMRDFIYLGEDYRQRTRIHLARAVEMLECGNRPAANAALVAALLSLNKELQIRIQRRYEFLPRIRFWIDKKGRYQLRRGKYIHCQVSQDEAIPLLVYEPTVFDLRWQAFQAIDHAIDNELDEIGYIENCLKSLEAIRSQIKEARRTPFGLSRESCTRFKQRLETMAKDLHPRWLIERFFVQCGLQIARGLITQQAEDNSGVDLLYYADAMLGIVKGFLESRKTECLRIIEGLESGLLREMRQRILAQNNAISESIERLAKSKNRILALGLSRRRIFKEEPEFQGMAAIFGWITEELAKPKGVDLRKVDLAISRARCRMTDVRLLYEFMVRFRYAYKEARLTGRSAECRYRVFNQTYLRFAKENNLVRGSPHLRIRFYQAAMPIPFRIKDPYNKEREITNPAFILTSTCMLLQYIRRLKVERIAGLSQKDYPQMRTVLSEFLKQGKAYLYVLDQKERRKILEALIADIYGEVKGTGLYTYPLSEEDRLKIEQALWLFLNPDLTGYAEMPDEVLSHIREKVENAIRLFTKKGRQDITQLEETIRDIEERYFSHIEGSLAVSEKTILGKIKALQIFLKSPQTISQAERIAKILVAQIKHILVERREMEKPFRRGVASSPIGRDRNDQSRPLWKNKTGLVNLFVAGGDKVFCSGRLNLFGTDIKFVITEGMFVRHPGLGIGKIVIINKRGLNHELREEESLESFIFGISFFGNNSRIINVNAQYVELLLD